MQQVLDTTRGLSVFTTPMTVATAAKKADVTPPTIRRWIKRGYLPAVQTSIGWCVAGEHLDAATNTALRARSRRRKRSPAPDVRHRELEAEVRRLADDNARLQKELNEMRETCDQLRREVADARTVEPASTPTLPPVIDLRARPASGPTEVAGRSEQAYRRLLEGLQRTIVFEESRRKRALRHRDRDAVRAAEHRLAELHIQLAAVEQEYAALRSPGKSSTPRHQDVPATTWDIPRLSPGSQRIFNVSTIMLLNVIVLLALGLVA